MGIEHDLQRFFACSTEWMFLCCESSGLVQQRAVVGHAVEGVVANIVLVEFSLPVKEVRDEWFWIPHNLVLGEGG